MYAEGDPHPDHEQHERLHQRPPAAARPFLAVGSWLAAVCAVVAGVGWLYLLNRAHAIDLGPDAKGALPLEELARRGAQPVGRMVIAWVPAGVAATLALMWIGRVRAVRAVVGVGLLTAAILFPTTAAAEALTRNERVSEHIGTALSRSGLWVAVAFAVIGSVAAAGAAAWRRRDGGTAASGAPGRGPWAA